MWSASDKLINQLGYLAVTLYLARLIGPESFGLIGMLTVFVLLADSIVNSGFSQALIQKSHTVTEEDASTIFYVSLFLGLIIYVALYFSAPIIASFYKQPMLVDISRILFTVILINSFSVVIRAKLTINIDFRSQAIAGSISVIISSALALYLASNGYGLWALVWLIVLKAILSNLTLWFFCRWYPKLLFSKQSFVGLFKFGSYLMLAGLGSTLLNNLYLVLIGRYFNVASVGYYTQSTNLSNFLSTFITSTLQSVTYPILTSIKEDKSKFLVVYKNLISITMLVSMPLFIGFAAVAEDFVLLFLGDEWLPAVPVLIALCFARAITPVNAINMNVLNAMGRSDLFLKVDLSKYPIVLAGFFIGMDYGVGGIAWAMVVTTYISFFFNAYFPGRMFQFGGVEQLKVAYKYIIASAIMFFTVSLISIHENIWLTLIVKILIGVITYTVILISFRDKFVLQKIKFLGKYQRGVVYKK